MAAMTVTIDAMIATRVVPVVSPDMIEVTEIAGTTIIATVSHATVVNVSAIEVVTINATRA